MRRLISDLHSDGVRVSLFVDPDDSPIRWAADIGAVRVELYTEPFARAFERGEPQARESFATYTRAAELAHSLKLGVNAGHDLDLDNLVLFRRLPHLDEVSIGHALVSYSLFVGLAQSRSRISRCAGCVICSMFKETRLLQLPKASSQRANSQGVNSEAPCAVNRRCDDKAPWSWELVLGVIVTLAALPRRQRSGRAVTFRSADGRTINARSPSSRLSVRLRPLCSFRCSDVRRRTGTPWARRLADANVFALAIDLAGLSDPGDSKVLAGWSRDVRAAVAYLSSRPDVRPGAIGIAGASLGASLGAIAAADDPAVRSLALISPALDYRGLRIEAPMKQFGGRPALLIASNHDPYAARSVRELAKDAAGTRETRFSDITAHGTALLARDGDTVRALIEWFQRTLGFGP
jgi:hypothetical protein